MRKPRALRPGDRVAVVAPASPFRRDEFELGVAELRSLGFEPVYDDSVFARDGYECQYCGSGSHLTMDHVVPRSRGGGSSWDNVVTSCAPCNLRKGNRLPHEIDMHPRTAPRPPRPDVFISVAAPRQPNAWLPYLAASAA